MLKDNAFGIVDVLLERFGSSPENFFASEINGTWFVFCVPCFGDQEFVKKHTLMWDNEVDLLRYFFQFNDL